MPILTIRQQFHIEKGQEEHQTYINDFFKRGQGIDPNYIN